VRRSLHGDTYTTACNIVCGTCAWSIGFTAVFEAMRACGAPAVGHNLAWDLAYTLEAFVGPLPPSWAEYKALAAAWFPGGVYDTKRLSTELPEVHNTCWFAMLSSRL